MMINNVELLTSDRLELALQCTRQHHSLTDVSSSGTDTFVLTFTHKTKGTTYTQEVMFRECKE